MACRRKFIIVCSCLVLAACATSSLRINNYSYLYNRKEFLLHPEYKIFHKSADSTVLYFKISSRNLLYTRREKNTAFTARFRIVYKLYNNLGDKLPLRVDSTDFDDADDMQQAKDLIGKLEFALPQGRDYFIALKATDLNRNVTDYKLLTIYKSGNSKERQSFLVFDADNQAPLISDFLSKDARLLIRYQVESTENLQVLFYQGDYPLARPPFDLAFEEKTVFKPSRRFVLKDSAGFFPLTVDASQGFYFMVKDTSLLTGQPLYRFQESFPEVSSGEQMLGPLRYLTSKDEFENLKKAPNAKIAAENFWIQRSGSRERAKEVIKEFYARVQDANEFFTSYKEGWKTDRGMIYIIFGPPDGLFFRDMEENWVYGHESNVMSLNFTFNRTENPFTDQDYVMERSPAYRSTWMMAVEAWRTGRLFSL